MQGHEKGVNCVDYYYGGDKPYLISGADDKLVKIWDYQVNINWFLKNVRYIFFFNLSFYFSMNKFFSQNDGSKTIIS